MKLLLPNGTISYLYAMVAPGTEGQVQAAVQAALDGEGPREFTVGTITYLVPETT